MPLPPSINSNVWKLGNKSPKVVKWQHECDAYLFENWRRTKKLAVKGPFALEVVWTDAEWLQSDCDNRLKPLLDLLVPVGNSDSNILIV